MYSDRMCGGWEAFEGKCEVCCVCLNQSSKFFLNTFTHPIKQEADALADIPYLMARVPACSQDVVAFPCAWAAAGL